MISKKIAITLYQGLLYKANLCFLGEKNKSFQDFMEDNNEVFNFIEEHISDANRLKNLLRDYFDHNKKFVY